jgi:hypothetical protein
MPKVKARAAALVVVADLRRLLEKKCRGDMPVLWGVP